MRSIFTFIIEPKEGRYNNKKKVNDKELILNSVIANHEYISRNAIVLETPSAIKTNIKAGDEVIVHHNIFRRYHDVHGNEVDSSNCIEGNKFFARQIKYFFIKGIGIGKPLVAIALLSLSKVLTSLTQIQKDH